jgi:hypothetical protein
MHSRDLKRRPHPVVRGSVQRLCLSLPLAAGLALAGPASAQDNLDKQLKAIAAQLKAQESRLEAQEKLLKNQQDVLAKQSAVIEDQRQELAKLHQTERVTATSDPKMTPIPRPGDNLGQPPVVQRATLTIPAPEARPMQTAQNNSPNSGVTPRTGVPNGPVGEAPKQDQQPQVVQSLPEGLAVLTPASHFIVMPSIEYTSTTNDRLVFRGVVLVPGINLGEVEASTDARNIASFVADLRYGITSRLEAEIRVPYTYSDDRATVLNQQVAGNTSTATQSLYLQDSGIGDVEIGARYQINDGGEDWPIFVANARVKTDTGMGPFDVRRDAAGIAQQVALGSGFWAAEGGFSMLKVTDPAVLFASANYVYAVPKDINQTIGNVFVGRVEPGDSVNVNLGFGFAINPDFSFSLGYEHSYVFPQYTMLGNSKQVSDSLQVGAMTLGLAYRLNNNMSLNGNFEFGVTQNAPDVRAVFSLPTTF